MDKTRENSEYTLQPCPKQELAMKQNERKDAFRRGKNNMTKEMLNVPFGRRQRDQKEGISSKQSQNHCVQLIAVVMDNQKVCSD